MRAKPVNEVRGLVGEGGHVCVTAVKQMTGLKRTTSDAASQEAGLLDQHQMQRHGLSPRRERHQNTAGTAADDRDPLTLVDQPVCA